MPFGCGSAAVVLLVLVFLTGIALSRGGMGSLLDPILSSIQDEVEKMFTKDVTAAEKAQFEAQMKELRDEVRQNRLSIDRLQPVLRTIREVSSDQRVTPAETEELIRALEQANRTAKR